MPVVFVSRIRKSSYGLLEPVTPWLMRLFARLWHSCRPCSYNPVPRTGPALVIANHPSHADPAFLMASCGRALHFLHAREYVDIFFLRHFFHLAGCIPVARGRPDKAAIRLALSCLEKGAAVGLFPEGEVEPIGSQCLTPGKTGAALLALRSHAPVYPAFIDGAPQYGSVLKDWLWPSRGVRVRFGPALDLSAYHGRRIQRDLLKEVTRLFMRAIAELRPAIIIEDAAAVADYQFSGPLAGDGAFIDPVLKSLQASKNGHCCKRA